MVSHKACSYLTHVLYGKSQSLLFPNTHDVWCHKACSRQKVQSCWLFMNFIEFTVDSGLMTVEAGNVDGLMFPQLTDSRIKPITLWSCDSLCTCLF